MFKKIVIANRGEIAVRIIRACRDLGIATVAVHSDSDKYCLHVLFADEHVCIGPTSLSQSYLDPSAIIAAAEITGADAIHPGYGFLSEDPEFAEICQACDITLIGPSIENMRMWGDKVLARQQAARLGLLVLDGSGVLRDENHAIEQAQRIGFPVMLKASAGGGGRGMRIFRNPDEVKQGFGKTLTEAVAWFKSRDLYFERYIENPRHIEFQVICDNGMSAVLGERECSIQRRHQKLIEEAPSPILSREQRQDMCKTIERAMRESGYSSLGTMEFLMDEKGELYFMEMNTRLQVEHPVTEMVTGIDLVAEQIRIAAREPVAFDEKSIGWHGHAIECRITAEDPQTFRPSPGLIQYYHAPGGPGVRVDEGIYGGYHVGAVYDSLLAKVICYANTRAQAIARMQRALDETKVDGERIKTTIPLHQKVLRHPDFLSGNISTKFLEKMLEEPPQK